MWIYDRVFIKPLPRYLLSYAFWTEYLLSEESQLGGRSSEDRETYIKIRKSALGLLRTYYYLIQHESDFEIARNQDARLLPSDVSWAEFCNFSKDFEDISDDSVSDRYHYGELRLTRLNVYSKILLWKFQYERVHGQYGAFFARFYGPLLFIFGITSIVLSAMQVELGVETLLTITQWRSFWFVCRWFAIITLVCMILLTLSLVSLLVGMTIDEWGFALRSRYGKSTLRKVRSDEA